MQAALTASLRETPDGREAEAVLRKCVHCGFCLATCPTYQLLGDELDSPRGRIYLIKQVLEGKAPTAKTQLHLDRCLTCRACETTCPSGVEYHKLLDTGRALVEARVRRDAGERLQRWALREVLPRRGLFKVLVWLGRLFGWALPASVRRQLGGRWGNVSVEAASAVTVAAKAAPTMRTPVAAKAAPTRRTAVPVGAAPAATVAAEAAATTRRMLMLQGCVQPGLRPGINAAAAQVLGAAGIAAIEVPSAGCCGALRFHLSAQDAAREDMRRLIDAWWPQIEAGAEAIVITASGCGAHVKDYGRLLRDDPRYADQAARVAALARDLSEVVEAEAESLAGALAHGKHAFVRVAFQSPCTLQHGQRITGVVELLLKAAGYELTAVAEAHLCCGSAGTYSVLQPALSRQLRERKLAALTAGNPDAIATANIGCQTHLAAGTAIPVHHWIELLADRLAT